MDDNNKPTSKGPLKNPRSLILYAVIALALIAIIFMQFNTLNGETKELATSEFTTALQENRVSEVTYSASRGTMKGKYWENEAEKGDKEKLKDFTSTWVGSDNLAETMQKHPEVTYKVDISSNGIWVSLLMSFVPILLLIGMMFYFMNSMQGPGSKTMQFGKSKAKQARQDRPKVHFNDVAGIDEAVDELEEIRDFLANPDKFQKLGAKIPRGVLLVGPPGTGKTLLAKAVAGEAGVPFFSISGSDFVEMFVGVGASRVRDLFEQAKAAAPAIIFIDEIDAVGRQRGAGLGGGHDEREQTLNQLLVEMDGFDENDSVILIAATNRPDILDPALLRPGRFDRQVTVDRPDVKGREQILRVHAANKPLDSDVDFSNLAKLTPGFTGADLANLMNEAALLTARRGKRKITMDEMSEAIERVVAGPERRSRIISEKEKKTIAYHESGHALVGHVLEHADPVHKISIIARGQALGYTLSMPEEDRFLNTKKEMLDSLAVFLGGRVAEEIAMDDITTGASNDLERATKIARSMVTRYGMSEELGTQVFGEAQHEVFLGRDYAERQDYSQDTAERIDKVVSDMMREAHDKAETILRERRDQLDLMVKVLLERETIEGKAVEALLNNTWDEYLVEEAKLKEKKAIEEAEQAKRDEELVAQEAQRLEAEARRSYQISVEGSDKTVLVLPDGTTKVVDEDGNEKILPPLPHNNDKNDMPVKPD
ncbi:MAG: ATP-dependent zinc metalloprotease FtsH [Coriobacteriia bacterium]|nr:ATP-dependent zinc metalloprotease FtsH [Coriobacteriia bacterium]